MRSADGPAGTNTACTDAGFDPRAAAWSCLSWALNLGHLEVIAPRRYDGACTHVRVDQSTGSWMCLSAVPLEPSVLPDSPAARLSF
jgi:hypothetical protein